MVGSHHNPLLQFIVTMLLECTFLGFCIVFIGTGVEGLRKKKDHFKNLVLIITGIFLAIMSAVATILLFRGRQ